MTVLACVGCFVFGVLVGVVLMACCCAAGDADERMGC